MIRVAFGLSVLAVLPSEGRAVAQPPVWAGGPPPMGSFLGYSPLVPSVNPFPPRSSGYSSFFAPYPYAGTGVYAPPVVVQSWSGVVVSPAGPTVVVSPARPFRRFHR